MNDVQAHIVEDSANTPMSRMVDAWQRPVVLSPQQWIVLGYWLEHENVPRIAEEMGLALATVYDHIRCLRHKLGVPPTPRRRTPRW